MTTTALLLPLALWLLLMVLASGAGLALVGAWPWAAGARRAGVALAVGLAVGPLLAGVAMVAALWALPGAAVLVQAGAVFAVLGALALAGWLAGVTQRTLLPRAELIPQGPAAVLTCGFFIAIAVDCVVVPLIQNDALEYATVGRILFAESAQRHALRNEVQRNLQVDAHSRGRVGRTHRRIALRRGVHQLRRANGVTAPPPAQRHGTTRSARRQRQREPRTRGPPGAARGLPRPRPSCRPARPACRAVPRQAE